MNLVEELRDPLRCKTKRRAVLSGGVLKITGEKNNACTTSEKFEVMSTSTTDSVRVN